jgi:hypothetical protein
VKKITSNSSFLSLAVLLVWFTFSLYWGERLQVRNGLGWDGVRYAFWAQTDPLYWLNSKFIGTYYATRILPSITVHYLANFFDYPLGDLQNPKGVINAFIVFNCSLIMGSVFLLHLTAKHLNWSPQVLMLGLVALFVNFPILKLSNYYPTLTDVPAFFFGLFIFYAYLRDWQFTLLILSMLASFVWPSMLYTALPLLVFPAQKLKFSIYVPSNLSNSVSAFIGGVLVAGTIYVYYVTGRRLPFGATPVNESMILLSAAMFFSYVFLMLRPFIDVTFFRSTLFSSVSWRGVLLSVILVVCVKLAIASYSSLLLDGPSLYIYLQNLGLYIITEPLLNVVAHVSYFGPMVVLMLLLWKDVVAVTKQYGPGLTSVLIIAMLMSIGTESRTLMSAWPILAILTCEALSRRGVKWSFVYSILAVGLFTSRFWLPININNNEPWVGSFQNFPYQMYFMNMGPWISTSMYVVLLTITLILFIALFIALRNMDEREYREFLL